MAQQVTFTSNNNKVVFNATGTTTATVDCNAEGKATVVISVSEDATNSATVTALAGNETAECVVTVLKNVAVTTQSDDTSIGTATTITKESYVEGSTIELNATVTNNDYKFDGWYEAKDSGTETQIENSITSTYMYTVPSDATTVVLKAKFKEKPTPMSASQSGVGYYIKKGDEYAIVFADRIAQAGTTVTWNANTPDSVSGGSQCTFPTISTTDIAEFKTYAITSKTYTTSYFGTKNIIEVIDDNEEDRFMALALSNFNTSGNFYKWYSAAYGKMSDFSSTGGNDGKGSPTARGFLKGKTNTETMITKWNNKSYGDQDTGSYKDVWGQIQSQAENGWFIPSFEEWSAFGWAMSQGKLKSGVTSWSSMGLSNIYLSSSQASNSYAWRTSFSNGYMNVATAQWEDSGCVRLAITF